MEKLSLLTGRYLDEDVSVAEMEKGYLRQALAMCLILLKFVIQIKLEQKRGIGPIPINEETIKSKGKRLRKYLSLFGMLEFSRPSYWSDQRGMLYVLDDALSFPPVHWSYNLQELAGESASQDNYRESIKVLDSLLELGLSGTASERNVNRLGQIVDEYYEQKQVPEPEGPVCFCASFDGKGVPKIKTKDKDSPKQMGRLGKGEKRGVKQMATVSVTSWFEPRKRDKEMVINGLMGLRPDEAKTGQKPAPNDNRWHQDIHRRAFLADQEKGVNYGIAQLKAMMRHPQSRFVVPVDAGIGLEDKIIKAVNECGLQDRFDGIILDLVHVCEYVWNCANAILGEQSKLRTGWVTDVLEDLLDSKTQKVIDDLQKNIDKGKLSKTKKETVQKAVTYFTNHQHKMNYKVYLDKGYPVSSALVESNCKHLVKDRMELSGMRWSSRGAQNMMDLRAVKLNGDMTDFISFVQRKDQRPCFARAA
jgi:hypothetical protein